MMPPGEVTSGFHVTTRTTLNSFQRLKCECLERINKQVKALGLVPIGRIRVRRKRLRSYRSGKQVWCELSQPVEWDVAYQLAKALGTIDP
jgi:hypothetical protein